MTRRAEASDGTAGRSPHPRVDGPRGHAWTGEGPRRAICVDQGALRGPFRGIAEGLAASGGAAGAVFTPAPIASPVGAVYTPAPGASPGGAAFTPAPMGAGPATPIAAARSSGPPPRASRAQPPPHTCSQRGRPRMGRVRRERPRMGRVRRERPGAVRHAGGDEPRGSTNGAAARARWRRGADRAHRRLSVARGGRRRLRVHARIQARGERRRPGLGDRQRASAGYRGRRWRFRSR